MLMDLSKFSAAGSFDISGTYPNAICASPDGTRFYISDMTNDEIVEYGLSTPFDPTTASYTDYFDVSANVDRPGGMWWAPDGLDFYVGALTDDKVAHYSCSVAWDVSTGTFQESFTTPDGVWGVTFNTDGTTMVCAIGNQYINEYTLSTPWDVSTAVLETSFNIDTITTAADANFTSAFFSADGKHIHLSNDTYYKTWHLTMSTPWDVSTIEMTWPGTDQSLNLLEYYGNNFWAVEKDAKQYLFLLSYTNKEVYFFTTPTLTTFEGVVQEEGSAVARTVRAYRRDTGELVDETVSASGDGSFTLRNLESAVEHYLIALDDDSGSQYNLIGYDKIVGV